LVLTLKPAAIAKCAIELHDANQNILQCRIERAKQLLRTTQLPIMEIAFQVGCKNHSYFSKLFRKLTGMSPRTYRNQY
jgi:AraC family transcriptional regulator